MKLFQQYRQHFIYRLAGLIAAILLLLLCLCLFISRYSMTQLRQNTLEMNDRLLTQTENRIQEYMDSLYHIAATFCYSPTTLRYLSSDPLNRLPDSEELAAVFSNILLLDDHILSAYLYDIHLDPIAAMGREFSVPSPKQFLEPVVTIRPLMFSADHGTPYLEMFYPIYDLESIQYQKSLGACIFVLEPDYLNGILQSSQVTEQTNVFLLDASDRIIAYAGNVYYGTSLPIERQHSDASHYFYSLPLSVNDWRLVSITPEHDLNHSDHWLNYLTYAVCLVSLLSFGILIFYYNHSITYPIQHITRFIRDINASPKERLDIDREDEIGIIANSLNRMLDEARTMQQELRRSQLRIYKAELAKKQVEILAYRNQINPHFLYNTFECIRGMALYRNADDIAEITMALSNVFRFAVKGEDIVSVHDEIGYILEYAKIIDYRFMGKISIDVDVEESITNKKVFKLLLQPLVENAVFHGLEQKIDAGLVTVQVFAPDFGRLCFIVEDDGCGIPPEKLQTIRQTLNSHKNTSRVGLFNIYQRLKLFYNDCFEFYIDSTPETGTRITILIPDDPKIYHHTGG